MQSRYSNIYDKLWEFLFYDAAEKCGVYGCEPDIKVVRKDEMPQDEPGE